MGEGFVTTPVNVRREDGGVLNGCRVWFVYDDDTGELIGHDQQFIEETD